MCMTCACEGTALELYRADQALAHDMHRSIKLSNCRLLHSKESSDDI
jgi:hypothetical protein